MGASDFLGLLRIPGVKSSFAIVGPHGERKEERKEREGFTQRSSLRAQPLHTVMQVTWSLVAGGAEMYAFTVASNLDPRRFRSVMCAIDQGGALEPEVERAGIPRFIMHRRPGIDLRLMWRLYRLFRRTGARVVHTHHFNQLFYSALGARLAGARIVHMEHSVEAYKRRRLRVALRVLSTLCDRVLAIGEDGARVLGGQVGIPARKLEVIRAGIDTAAFTESKAEARRALGLGESDRVAAIVARLYPEKNHSLLLEAFAEARRRVAGAKLLIVGEGTARRAIEEKVAALGLEDSVRLLGVRRDVARVLAAADLFVLSSDREGLPIAVLEAMAAARPVIATAVGDLPAVVRDGQTGRLVPPGDGHALSEALVELFEDPARAAAMGETGRRMAAETYGLRAMIQRFESIYQGKKFS